jgi:amino acid transporter
MGGDGWATIFYILSLLAAVWFFIWSIANFADANGFVQVSKNFSDGHSATAVFGIITAILMMLISLVAIINAILFYKRDD